MSDERYPTRIENFHRWYGDLMLQIQHANSEHDIVDAVEAIRPYADAKWCFPHRLTDAEAMAAKRRKFLKSKRSFGDRTDDANNSVSA